MMKKYFWAMLIDSAVEDIIHIFYCSVANKIVEPMFHNEMVSVFPLTDSLFKPCSRTNHSVIGFY